MELVPSLALDGYGTAVPADGALPHLPGVGAAAQQEFADLYAHEFPKLAGYLTALTGPDRVQAVTGARATGAGRSPGPTASGAEPSRASGPVTDRTAAVPTRPVVTTGPMSRSDSSRVYPDGCPVQRTAAGEVDVCPFGGATPHDGRAGRAAPGITDLYLDVCSYDTQGVQLHFDTTLEANVAVLDREHHELWRWSREHPASPDRHTLPALGTGSCWQWTTAWAWVDQLGHRLAPGSYVLRFTGLARELGTRRTYDTAVQVS